MLGIDQSRVTRERERAIEPCKLILSDENDICRECYRTGQ